MELRRQIGIVRSWFWLLLASVLLAGGAAYIVSANLPRVYEATNTLIVGQGLSATNPVLSQLQASQNLSQTYADVATTRPILDKVSAKLNLGLTAEELRAKVKANAPTNSTLIAITASDGDPATAAAIANAVADGLIAASPAIQGQQGDSQAFVAKSLLDIQGQIDAVQGDADRLTGLPVRTAAEDQQLATLQSQLITLRSSYATLLQLSSNSASNLLTVVEPAVPPVNPSSPRPLLNTLLAALVGLLIALGIAFTVEYLDDTVKSSADVEEVVALPTLGAVAKMKGDRKRSEIYRVVTLINPRSATAEAFRSLRTNVDFASVDRPVRTLLVTSSIPGEGKTTTASNLAVVFAQAGKRVILVDGDLRKPGVHKILNLENTSGLTTLLPADGPSPEAVWQATEQENLRVITTGPLPPNPAELMASKRFRTVLERLTELADLVIIDSPPLQAVADAAILSAVTDGTLFVIDAGRTRRGAIRQGRETLAKADANVLGAVMNRLSERSQGEYYYYSYRGYYGADQPTEAKTGVSSTMPAFAASPPGTTIPAPPGAQPTDPGGSAGG